LANGIKRSPYQKRLPTLSHGAGDDAVPSYVCLYNHRTGDTELLGNRRILRFHFVDQISFHDDGSAWRMRLRCDHREWAAMVSCKQFVYPDLISISSHADA